MAVKKVGDRWFVVKKSGKLGVKPFLSKATAESSQRAGKRQGAKFGGNLKSKSRGSSHSPKATKAKRRSTGGASSHGSHNGNGRKKGMMKPDTRGRKILRTGVKIATDPRVAGFAFGPLAVADFAVNNITPGATLTERLANGLSRMYTGFDLTDGTFDFRNRAGATYTAMVGGFVGHGLEKALGITQARTTFLNIGSRKSVAVAATQVPAMAQAFMLARGGVERGGIFRGLRNWNAQRVISSSGIDMLNRGGGPTFTPQFNRNDLIAGTGVGAVGVQMHKFAQGSFNPIVDPSRMLPAVF